MAEVHIDAHFPLAGLSRSDAFGRQPARPVAPGVYARTTGAATNVRSNDILTRRLRGGSRSGLTRYVPAAVSAVGQRVQCLDFLVQPDADAVAGARDYNPGDPGGAGTPAPGGAGTPAPGIYDPSTDNNAAGRGRRKAGPHVVREGGSAQQPNRNRPGQIIFEQWQHFFDNIVLTGEIQDVTISFTKAVKSGSLLLVAILTFPGVNGGEPAPVTAADINDNLGTIYTPVGSAAESGGPTLTVFWGLAKTGGACTVEYQVINTDVSPINPSTRLLEYSGVAASSPLDNATTASGTLNGPLSAFTLSVGPIGAAKNGSLVLGFFAYQANPAWGFTAGPAAAPGSITDPHLRSDTAHGLDITDLLPTAIGTSEYTPQLIVEASPSPVGAGSHIFWAAIGVSFLKA